MNPQLSQIQLTVQPAVAPGALAVSIYAMAASSAAPVLQTDRVAVTVRSEGGEVVMAELGNPVCFDASGAQFRCDAFIVRTGSASSMNSYLERLGNLPAVVYAVSISNGAGVVFVDSTLFSVRISSGDLANAMQTARGWPGVASVSPSYFGSLEAGPPQTSLTGVVPAGLVGSNHIAGGVRVASGGAVTIAYLQPDGSTLRASAVVP